MGRWLSAELVFFPGFGIGTTYAVDQVHGKELSIQIAVIQTRQLSLSLRATVENHLKINIAWSKCTVFVGRQG